MINTECSFCGQLINVVDDSVPHPEELAKLTCDCEGARKYQEQEKSITNAKAKLEEMVRENENTLITSKCLEILKAAIEQVGKEIYISTTIKCNDTETVTILKTMTKIKIKYKQAEIRNIEE